MPAATRSRPLSIKIALCAVALMGMGSLAASAGLSYIADEFPQIPQVWLQLLVTGPVLLQVPVGLSASWLSSRFSPKTLLLAGIALFLICGVTPFFIHSFVLLLLLRVLYGAAIGISTTLASSLCFFYFQNERARSKAFGLVSAFSMFGGMYYTYVGGRLSEYGWQYCFLAYLIGIPIFLLVAMCLPDSGCTQAPCRKGLRTYALRPEVLWVAFLTLVYMLLYFAYTNNISVFVVHSGMGGASEAGISYSIVNGCGFLGGLLFSRFYLRTKHWIMPLAYAITTAGFFIIALSHTLPSLFAGSVLIGISIAWVLPQANILYGEIMPPEAMTFTVGITGAIANLGQLLSTFALTGMASLFSVQDERGVLLMAAAEYIALTAVSAVYIARRTRRAKRI